MERIFFKSFRQFWANKFPVYFIYWAFKKIYRTTFECCEYEREFVGVAIFEWGGNKNNLVVIFIVYFDKKIWRLIGKICSNILAVSVWCGGWQQSGNVLPLDAIKRKHRKYCWLEGLTLNLEQPNE